MPFCCSHKGSPAKISKSAEARRELIDWRAAESQRDRQVKEVRPAMIAFFRAMQGAVPLAAMSEAISSGNPSPVLDRIVTPELPPIDIEALPARQRKAATPITPTGLAIAGLAQRMEAEQVEAALRYQTAMRTLAWASGEAAMAELGGSFSLRNPWTIPWLEQRTAELVTEITSTTREAIREVVADAYLQGGSASRLARTIRPLIGLRSDQIRAVMRRSEELAGLSAAAHDRAIDAYGRKLLRQRAELIARTETVFAQAAGQDQAFRQAVEEGLVLAGAVRVWVADPGERTCPICSDLDGKESPIGGAFEGLGDLYELPPAHPNCRCAVVLETKI